MSDHESFWKLTSFAFVGNSEKKPFPKLSYGAARTAGKKVFAVDPSAETIEGDKAFDDLASLPEAVEGAVLEVPREETEAWVGKAAEAGIKNVWIHMGRDSPEALALAEQRGLDVRSGTCAVMYLKGGYHSIHKVINKLIGKY